MTRTSVIPGGTGTYSTTHTRISKGLYLPFSAALATEGIHNAKDMGVASQALAWGLVGLALVALVGVTVRLLWNHVEVLFIPG